MTAEATHYKVLNDDGSCIYGVGAWPVPSEDGPGEWLKVDGPLVACQSGLHVCDSNNLIGWLGQAIYEVECDPAPVRLDRKLLTNRARLVRRFDTWNERSARIFAAHCALDVLPIFEREHPDDFRPRTAIVAALKFADDDTTRKEMAAARAAAGDAAWAAGDAAGAARDAAGRWQSARLAAVLR